MNIFSGRPREKNNELFHGLTKQNKSPKATGISKIQKSYCYIIPNSPADLSCRERAHNVSSFSGKVREFIWSKPDFHLT